MSKPTKPTTTPADATPAPVAKPAATPRVITLVATANPKKVGSASYARFALYTTGQSVAAYVEACKAKGQKVRNATADIAWDTKRGYITVA
jgi:hypothetical protein